MGAVVKTTDILYHDGTLKQVVKIIQDHECYMFLRSGRRLPSPMIGTDRYKKSFVPSSIGILTHRSHVLCIYIFIMCQILPFLICDFLFILIFCGACS